MCALEAVRSLALSCADAALRATVRAFPGWADARCALQQAAGWAASEALGAHAVSDAHFDATLVYAGTDALALQAAGGGDARDADAWALAERRRVADACTKPAVRAPFHAQP